ncbi:hypothetical protein SIAM614_01504 [Stappia aggregata IAM 12614]|uniref:TauD/TfdA-like domain-containing protein n=1 Tax=Roseibium aggregatum (strain ATCC 25650 / DSM 13394 / JCM 20685 / NBRC 16684 / NCIMB 2208 / IAM 12614 / B1) TaxID=384765 RepID=A0P0W1_ROSAI|nr:TauD/TfdA family dioxygenase [Roseibium aggregatum]EAV41425.1 hypothetical protein SIAM614_01504 [Stappia aggregata IAM 12614] [Roseibium aggregatum IAM 12614]
MNYFVKTVVVADQATSLIDIIVDQLNQGIGVLIIRNVHLQVHHLERLAHALGTPVELKSFHANGSNVVLDLKSHGEDGQLSDLYRFGRSWHTDYTTTSITGGYTALYCLDAPEVGGGTKFISLDTRELPESARSLIEKFCGRNPCEVDVEHSNPKADKTMKSAMHPLFRKGMKGEGCYISLGSFAYSRALIENQGFIRNMYNVLEQEGKSHVAECSRNQLIVWNNAYVAHKAMPYNSEQYRRHMLRIATWGTRPLRSSPLPWRAESNGPNNDPDPHISDF